MFGAIFIGAGGGSENLGTFPGQEKVGNHFHCPMTDMDMRSVAEMRSIQPTKPAGPAQITAGRTGRPALGCRSSCVATVRVIDTQVALAAQELPTSG